MTPTQRLTEDMKNALRAHNKMELEAVRFLLAQVKNAEIDKPNREALTDAEFIKLVQKLLKNAQESIDQFRNGSREDLAEEEEKKVVIWKRYMPAQMSEDELRTIISDVIAAHPGVARGPLTGKVMAQVAGQADGGTVSRILGEML